MAMAANSIDPKTGFCSETNTFHSLRPPVPLPPETLSLSFPSFAFSLLPSPLPSAPAFIDAATGRSLSYSSFISQVHSLSSNLKSQFRLSKGDVAFVLSPSRLDVPVLYFALLSIGAVVCPANPISTPTEVSKLIDLVNPSVVFATSATASKLPANVTAVLLDSPEFTSSLLTTAVDVDREDEVYQSDVAAILFSSGTTGQVKAAAIPHRSFIAMAAGFYDLRQKAKPADVMLLLAPMVHSLGFFFALKGVALGETTVVMGRAGLEEMVAAAERFRVTVMTVAPPVVVGMARLEAAGGCDLGALERVVCGGAPLPVEVAERFLARFQHVELQMVSYRHVSLVFIFDEK